MGLRSELAVDVGRCTMSTILLPAGQAIVMFLLAIAVVLSLILTLQSFYPL